MIDVGIFMKDYVCVCFVSYFGDSLIVDINYLEEFLGSLEIIVVVFFKSE